MSNRVTVEPKHWLYIDANIYLSFYKSTGSLRKLLPSLKEIRNNIFVTRQLRDEVDRNKLYVAHQTLDAVREKVKWKEWNLPDLLFHKLGKGGPTWTEQAKADEKQVLAAIDSVLTDVTASADSISVDLKPIFANARVETADELAAARARKELGNPPGKRSDPLGDQLSWTQLLGVLQPKDKLWVVTQDQDYHVTTGGKLRLNAFLVRELMDRGLKVTAIHAFDNVANALKNFSASALAPVRSLPKPDVLEAAAKEERESLPTISHMLFPSQTVPNSGVFWDSDNPSLPLWWRFANPRASTRHPSDALSGVDWESAIRNYEAQRADPEEVPSAGSKIMGVYFPKKQSKQPVKLRKHWTKRKKQKGGKASAKDLRSSSKP